MNKTSKIIYWIVSAIFAAMVVICKYTYKPDLSLLVASLPVIAYYTDKVIRKLIN